MPQPFHLGWFTNFTPGDWTASFSHGGSPWDGKFFVEMAQAMERGRVRGFAAPSHSQ